MRLATFAKQPSEYKDYDVDFAPWLAGGDTIDMVDVMAVCLNDPADRALTATVRYTATRAKVWVGGGTHGQRYKVELTVTTVAGRVDQSELIFKVKEL